MGERERGRVRGGRGGGEEHSRAVKKGRGENLLQGRSYWDLVCEAEAKLLLWVRI